MGMIEKALSTSLAGIQQGVSSAVSRAERISEGITADNAETMVSDFVGFKLDLYQVGANRKVIEVTRELEKSTLDIIA